MKCQITVCMYKLNLLRSYSYFTQYYLYNILFLHYRDRINYAFKCLLERCFGPEFTYSSGVLGFLETIIENLKLMMDRHKNM